MASLNNAQAPSIKEIIATAKRIYQENKDMDEVQNYLSEVASYDYSCPDKCDGWAMDFLEENEEEIMEP